VVWILLHERLLSIISLRADGARRAVATAVCCFPTRTTRGGVRPIDAVEGVYRPPGSLRARLSLVSCYSTSTLSAIRTLGMAGGGPAYPLAGLGTGVASDSFLVTNQSQLFSGPALVARYRWVRSLTDRLNMSCECWLGRPCPVDGSRISSESSVGLPVCVRSMGAARRFEGGLGARPYGYGGRGGSAASWFSDFGVMASAVQMAGRRVQVKERLRAVWGMRGTAYVVCSLDSDSDSAAVVKAKYALNPAEYFVHECRTTLCRCTASSQSATCKCGREGKRRV
jgi:hypothetical protein